MRFEDRVVIVTGGASGIGKAIARAFADEGATVVILDKAEEEAKNVVKEIESQGGGKAVAMKVEATDGQQVKTTVKRIIAKWSRIDILVNNIGDSESIPFLETTEEDWRCSLDINLMVPLRFCHAVLPYMIKQQYGKVVNISSAVGRQAVPLAVAYSAAKAGVIAITRSLAAAMATYNIRVNCVCPGSIETPLSIRILGEHPEHVENLLKQSLLKRTGHPKEVAPVVLFLASEEASYMLGQSLSVDGGRVML